MTHAVISWISSYTVNACRVVATLSSPLPLVGRVLPSCPYNIIMLSFIFISAANRGNSYHISFV